MQFGFRTLLSFFSFNCRLSASANLQHHTNSYPHVRSEVLAAVEMQILFAWVVTLCGLVGREQPFAETFFLKFQGSMHFQNFVCT
jgi:hypothetical protein